MIVSVIWRKPVLTYAVSVSIDGLGEFGEYGYRKADRRGTENASGDDKKQSKCQPKKNETTSGGDPMYFNNISRSAFCII